MFEYKLRRWAERDGKIVKWGNVVGPYRGQEFEEEFGTEEEAKERQRQAVACEPIGDDREPVARRRIRIHWGH
jgi:hypothetical protein